MGVFPNVVFTTTLTISEMDLLLSPNPTYQLLIIIIIILHLI